MDKSEKNHLQDAREANASTGTLLAPNVRKFRPFTMNLMTDVSIIFADIAGKQFRFFFEGTNIVHYL